MLPVASKEQQLIKLLLLARDLVEVTDTCG